MAKLTLSVDERVVSQAKRYARAQGISVSEMVETYLAAVVNPAPMPEDTPPVLRSLRGVLRTGSVVEYRKHLVKKFK